MKYRVSSSDFRFDLSLQQLSSVTVEMPRPSASQTQSQHGLNDDDIEKMVSDAVFYFLVADQKKSIIKVKQAILFRQSDASKNRLRIRILRMYVLFALILV